MRRALGWYAVFILALSVYLGFGNASDVVNTATIPQKLVGVTATAYALVALVCLEGIRRSARWLFSVALVWATLIVVTGALASAVYAASSVVKFVAMIVSILIVAPVVVWARERANPQSVGRGLYKP
jgi:hypothetical protein